MWGAKTTTLLRALADRDGGMVASARKIGVHFTTLYRASAGRHVSLGAQARIESHFGRPLAVLQLPVDALLGAIDRKQRPVVNA